MTDWTIRDAERLAFVLSEKLDDDAPLNLSRWRVLAEELWSRLNADGLPVVRTVGDLTARHLGRRVRVQRFEGVLSGIFATSTRPISLHIDDANGALWIVGPESDLDLETPCEVLT